MSLFNINLPESVLADLFKHSLIDYAVEPEVQQQAPQEVAPLPISYVGENKHQITIGVYFSAHKTIPAEHIQFLTSILKACQRSIDHVAVVNFAERELELTDIITQLQPKILMLFGAYQRFGSWMTDTEDFAPFQLHNIQVVRVPELEKMLGNTPESRVIKSKLWLMLKQLFNL